LETLQDLEQNFLSFLKAINCLPQWMQLVCSNGGSDITTLVAKNDIISINDNRPSIIFHPGSVKANIAMMITVYVYGPDLQTRFQGWFNCELLE